jgi:hypothetical protein
MGQYKIRSLETLSNLPIKRLSLSDNLLLAENGFYILEPLGRSCNVILPTPIMIGAWFVIKNISKEYAIFLKEIKGKEPLLKLSLDSALVQVFVIYDGIEWHVLEQ